MNDRNDGPVMYVSGMAVVLNRWFTTYEEARSALESDSGYLFPYGDHYFVTEREGVRALGLNPDDPNWARIGWDWVRPKDLIAWKHLRNEREIAMCRSTF